MQKKNIFILGILASACMTSVFAATPVDLNHQPVSLLKSFFSLAPDAASLTSVSSASDFNQTKHIRLKQTYAGVPVWGGDAVVHVPEGSNFSVKTMSGGKSTSMNGLLYQGLNKDLGARPALQTEQVLHYAVKQFQETKGNLNPVSEQDASLIVYVDDNNRAHWAYLVSFLVSPNEGLPMKPTYIMDASTFHVYHEWDNIQTQEGAKGGGFGGNEGKVAGKYVYDGLEGNLPKLDVDRDATKEVCLLKNTDVTVKDRRKRDAVVEYSCTATDPDHDNVWWDADFDKVNGGYSPSNDALYAGAVIQDMYMNWYGIPPLVDSAGNKKMLNMRVHEYMDNAYWDGSQMTFGDGITMFYPLVSLGVGAHEISHGFTQQHANLAYYSQSGGLNEAFSDMAAQGAEFFSVEHNSWQIGPEIMKKGGALRYMDKPSKDCGTRKPGDWCSIDTVSQYKEGLDVHYSSGVFNRVFYLIGTSDGWDTRKAFDIMVQANMNYWTSTTKWTDAACGVLKATADYKYDNTAVKAAFETVGVDISKC